MGMYGRMLVFSALLVLFSLPRDYAGEVTSDCKYTDTSVKITYTGETFRVFASNKDNVICDFQLKEGTVITYELVVNIQNQNDGKCYMDKKENLETYSIVVETRNMHAFIESVTDEEFFIGCNFETGAPDIQSSATLGETPKQPKVITELVGKVSNATFDMEVIRVDGSNITDLQLGLTVRLKVVMSPADAAKELGFKPTVCKATNLAGTKQHIMMVDGCGVGGMPWKSTEGFTNEGLTTYSPYFRVFKLSSDMKNIKFTCDFVICTQACLGTSCGAARRKRSSIDHTPDHAPIHTPRVLTDPASLPLMMSPVAMQENKLANEHLSHSHPNNVITVLSDRHKIYVNSEDEDDVYGMKGHPYDGMAWHIYHGEVDVNAMATDWEDLGFELEGSTVTLSDDKKICHEYKQILLPAISICVGIIVVLSLAFVFVVMMLIKNRRSSSKP